MKKDSRTRLHEVMQRLDKTFKPVLNEDYNQLLDYFQNMWSTSEEVKKRIFGNSYLFKKYSQYINPAFDWSGMNEEQLRLLWKEWSVDDESLNKLSSTNDVEDEPEEYVDESEDQTFMLDGEEVYFKLERYDKNGALAVELWDSEGPYAMVSSNLESSSALPDDEFFLKDWGENEHLAQQLINQKVIIPTGEQDEELGAQSYKIAPEYSKGGIMEQGHDGGGEAVSEDDEFFEITAPVNSEDEQLFINVVNQGIDSHLEGFTKSKFDVRQGSLGARRVFNFHKSELPLLLRRLRELGTEEADLWADDIENYDVNINEMLNQ